VKVEHLGSLGVEAIQGKPLTPRRIEGLLFYVCAHLRLRHAQPKFFTSVPSRRGKKARGGRGGLRLRPGRDCVHIS
jgi:hypothetical protein